MAVEDFDAIVFHQRSLSWADVPDPKKRRPQQRWRTVQSQMTDDPDMRGQYVQITKIRYLCFDLVHSRYTRMAGFGRREIELMQALCIYNIYIYRVLLCGYHAELFLIRNQSTIVAFAVGEKYKAGNGFKVTFHLNLMERQKITQLWDDTLTLQIYMQW